MAECYNPFDLVEVRFGHHVTYARPLELDAEIVNFDKMTDAAGRVVKPCRFSTTCPECGDGIMFDAIVGSYPFVISYPNIAFCDNCVPNSKVVNPFKSSISVNVDPLVSTIVTTSTLPANHDLKVNDLPEQNLELLDVLSEISESEKVEEVPLVTSKVEETPKVVPVPEKPVEAKPVAPTSSKATESTKQTKASKLAEPVKVESPEQVDSTKPVEPALTIETPKPVEPAKVESSEQTTPDVVK